MGLSGYASAPMGRGGHSHINQPDKLPGTIDEVIRVDSSNEIQH